MATKKPLNISEEAAVQMPMKTDASLIVIVALGTMGYFQNVERLKVADTRIKIIEKELGASLEETFTSFNKTPLAAASVAQIFEAELICEDGIGADVVVKVSYTTLNY